MIEFILCKEKWIISYLNVDFLMQIFPLSGLIGSKICNEFLYKNRNVALKGFMFLPLFLVIFAHSVQKFLLKINKIITQN
jgi:hypothetical protein